MSKEIIQRVLENPKVTHIVIEYEGSGDSGNYSNIQYLNNGKIVDRATEYLSREEKDNISEMGMMLIDSMYPGWEIDEGAEGEITFYLEDGEININVKHGTRYTTLDIEEKKLDFDSLY